MSSSVLMLNGISDSWIDRCYYQTSSIFSTTANTFNRLFHYDYIITVVFLVLVILPILFNIYGSGVQQRLRRFYDSARAAFVRFLFECSFAVGMCTVFHLLVEQAMPCVQWDGRSLYAFTNSSRTPNDEIVLLLMICQVIWSLPVKLVWLRRLLVICFLIFDCVIVVLNGTSSIFQVLMSAALGVWVIAFTKFIPPIGIPICSGILLLVESILFGLSFSKYGFKVSLIRESLHLTFRSLVVLLISVFMMLRYSCTRESFDWFKSPLKDIQGAKSSRGEAVIPSMVVDATTDMFGALLQKDLIDSTIGFVLYLLGNFLLFLFDSNYRFMYD